MPYLQFRDSRYQLATGEVRVGRQQGAEIQLPADAGDKGAQGLAVVSLSGTGGASVRRSTAEGTILLNGVAVGYEPSPVLHGDRISIGGIELNFADEALLGDTVAMPIASEDSPRAEPSEAAATSKSNGRLVSLVDGREYPVPPAGLSIGREADCDIVITSPEVSRRHAEIRGTPRGFSLLDRSSNGVLLNGKRVWAEVALGRGDLLRIGKEEFRFYADVASSDVLDLASVPALQRTAAIPAIKRPVAAPQTQSKERQSLASLEVINEGPTKGARHEVFAPIVNIGRGEHNDIVVSDESVSDSHAKLQRRDDAWWLMDMGSTNGTYVRGERLVAGEESKIESGFDLRFGGVKTIFRPSGATLRASGETRVIVGIKGPDPKRAEQRLKELARHVDRESEQLGTSSSASRAPKWLWGALFVLVAYLIYLVLQGR